MPNLFRTAHNSEAVKNVIDTDPNVPMTRVLTKDLSEHRSLARPKSDTLAFQCRSRRMLLDLMSRWTILGSNPS